MTEFTRRGALAAATTSAAAVSLGVPALARSDGSGDPSLHTGTVVAKPGPNELSVAISGQPEVVVSAERDAYITRGAAGVQADLSAFRPGDAIVFRGSLTDGRCRASEVQSLYRGLRTRYTGRSPEGDKVRTEHGSLRIAEGTSAREQVSRLKPQDVIEAEVWLDPDGSEPVLMAVSVPS